LKSYVPFLSLRYLRFHKVSTALGILGVSLGVGLVIVVVGVMDGFQARLRRSLLSNTAAVVVRPRFDVDAGKFADALVAEVPGVLAASPIVSAVTLVQPEDGTNAQSVPCTIMGIDAARENAVSDLGPKLRRGSTAASPPYLLESASLEQPFRTPDGVRARDRRLREDKQGIILGKNLFQNLGVRLGERVHVFSAQRKDPAAKPGGTSGSLAFDAELFTVTGVFNSGDQEVDEKIVLMDRRDALSYFREWLPQEADEVRLRLRDPEACDAVAAEVHRRRERLVSLALKPGGRALDPALRALTWKEQHARLLSAVENERGLLLVITSFSFLVVAFLIGSTQSMLVVEKTREIGVLRALGASVAGTAGVFLGNGLFIGIVGAAGGWALGMGVTGNIQEISVWIRETFGRDLVPPDIYRFATIPIEVKGEFVLSVCTGAVAFALLGALLPALRAALLDPVESLHHE
jgi:lipoprotein-releasing system permease protein